jgi:hypothetical protein
MPTATSKPAPKATVTEKIIRTEERDPIEVDVKPAAVPVQPNREFWKYIQSLTDEDWKSHKVTLYRYPLGQVKPDKLGRYVKTYKAGNPLLSEDQVYEEFGGSQYTAMLTGPKDGQKSMLIACHNWEMDGPVRNPWQISAGTPAGGVPSELASTLQVVLDKLSAAQRSANPAADPAVKESISLIQQLTSAFKPQGITELVSGLADLQKLTGASNGSSNIRETLTLLKELGVIGERPRSLAQEIKEVLEIAGLLGNGGGEARPGARVDWPTALVQNLPGILEKVTPIADKFADAARANARVAEARAGRVIPNTPSASLTAAAVPVPAAESRVIRTVAAPETEPAISPAAPPGAAPAPGAPPGAAEVFRPPNMEWVKGKAVQMFQAGKSGDEIAEFLDNLDDNLGEFLASMNEEKFRQFIETDPIMRAIAPAPRYPTFVRDFVGYFSEAPESDEDAPPPAKKA